MNDPKAELSSITSALEDLTTRVTGMAEDLMKSEVNDMAHELFEVERSLEAAKRRLNSLLR